MLRADTKKLIDDEIREMAEGETQTGEEVTSGTKAQLLESIGQSAHAEDEEFNPSVDDIINVPKPSDTRGNGLGTKYPKQSAEEAIIDELLVSVPRAQGYYLKLYKEVRPNELELKQRIDNYEHWSDLEWEVTKLVRDMTKRDPEKWGSAKYKIVIWKEGGLRGQKRPPIDFYIDAQESKIQLEAKAADPIKSFEAQAASLGTFLESIRKFQPEAMSPSDHLRIVAESMKTGQELTQNKEGNMSSAMAQMMTAMVAMMQQSNQQMMQVIATMNGGNKSITNDPVFMLLLNKMMEDKGNKVSALSMVKELKEAGLIPQKSETGLSGELKNLTMLMEVAREFGGGGDGEGGGGVLETLAKAIGAKLPELVGNVTGTINKVVEFNKQKLAAMNRPPALPQNPPKEVPQEPEQTEEEKMRIFVKIFTDKLYQWVVNKDYTKFEEVTKAIRMLTGGAPVVEDAIKQGTMAAGDLMKFVTDQDTDHYGSDGEKELLEEFVVEYINHIKNDGRQLVNVKCQKCEAEYNYDSEEEFKADLDDGVKCDDCGGDLIQV